MKIIYVNVIGKLKLKREHRTPLSGIFDVMYDRDSWNQKRLIFKLYLN